MGKEFYTAKEIIVGTRSEYLRNERELLMLKELVCSDDKEVDDFYFEVVKLFGKSPEIICKFIQNPKTMRGFVRYISEKMGRKASGYENGYLRKAGYNYRIDNSFYDASIKEGKEKEFVILIRKILNSTFVNNIDCYDLRNGNEKDKDISMIVTGTCVMVSNVDSDFFDRIIYYSRNDSILATSTRNFDAEMLERLINFEVPAYCLSEYHRQIIDNNPSTYKPLEICSSVSRCDGKRFRMLIEESEDKITFTKTRIRKR